MHVAEGMLAAPVLIAGGAAALAGTAVGLRKMDQDSVVDVAVISSAFFVASLINVPVGGVPVHLTLCGLAGLILGWSVFPAILTALLLQAVLFGYGGLTTLGVNTIIMALPGFCCHLAFGRWARAGNGGTAFAAGFTTGAVAFGMSIGILVLSLVLSGTDFHAIAALVSAVQIPIIVIEGLVTGFAVAFLRKVRPETFAAVARAALHTEEGAA